jgi:hypothetical protein
MKKILVIIFGLVILSSCSDEENPGVPITQVSLTFNHNWDGLSVNNTDFNSIKFRNENNDELSIERLRYLVSNITFQNQNGETLVLDGYNLVDLSDLSSLNYQLMSEIPMGTYTNVSFTFGFNNQDNQDGIYPDLNVASWNVPMMLGGGYHYMQLDGKFINESSEEQGYQYHAIRAVDRSDPENLIFQDTFFTVNLGEVIVRNNSEINIEINIAQWFKEPNLWDLNQLNSMLMPNFDAQLKMYYNGQNVFSLGTVQ